MWHLGALGATGAQAPWWEPPLHALLAQLNEKFLNQASADEHADKLLELTLEDTQLGRMSSPLPYMPRGREGATDIDMEVFFSFGVAEVIYRAGRVRYARWHWATSRIAASACQARGRMEHRRYDLPQLHSILV